MKRHNAAQAKNARAVKRSPYKLRFHIGFLVHDVSRLRGTFVDRALKPLGITRSQWWLLVCLSQFDEKGVNQRQLANSMQVTDVAIGEMLAILDTQGYIARRMDPADRRQKLILLTDFGYEILEHSRKIAYKFNKKILKDVTEEDLAVAQNVLRQMGKNILALEQRETKTELLPPSSFLRL